MFIKVLINILSWASRIENRFFYNKYAGEIGFFAFIRDFLLLITKDAFGLSTWIYEYYSAETRPINFYFAGSRSLFVKQPEHINTLLVSDKTDLSGIKMVRDRMKDVLGINLITVEPEHWPNMRRRTMAYLQNSYLSEYEKYMLSVVEKEMLVNWKFLAKNGKPLDVWDTMLYYSTKGVFMSFIGVKQDDVPEQFPETLNQLFDVLRQVLLSIFSFPRRPKSAISRFLMAWIPSSVSFDRKMKKLENYIIPYIEKYRDSNTLFGSIIRSNTEIGPIDIEDLRFYIRKMINNDLYIIPDDAILSLQSTPDLYQRSRNFLDICKLDQKYRIDIENYLCYGINKNPKINISLVLEEIIGILLGASETTVSFMSFGIYLLSTHPHEQEKLRDYLRNNNTLNLDEQIRNGYLGYILNEILRFLPPIPMSCRILLEDIKLEDGTILPKQVPIWYSQYYVHRDTSYWGPDADQFRPSRWNVGPTKGSYFPFGNGRKSCIGNNYAKREAGIIFSVLVNNFSFELMDKELQLELDPNVTMHPKNRIPIRLNTL